MGKSVKDAMTSNPCTIDADQTVAYAARMLKDENVGLAPVVEGNRLVGTLTDRDIVVRVVADGRDPQTVKVREVASSALVTVDPEQDLDELAVRRVNGEGPPDVVVELDDGYSDSDGELYTTMVFRLPTGSEGFGSCSSRSASATAPAISHGGLAEASSKGSPLRVLSPMSLR